MTAPTIEERIDRLEETADRLDQKLDRLLALVGISAVPDDSVLPDVVDLSTLERHGTP